MKAIRLAVALGWTALAVTAVGIIGVTRAHAQQYTAAETKAEAAKSGSITKGVPQDRGAISIAIALSIAASCLGAGYAVGKVGAAALGAVVEHPEMMGRSLIFVGLAEGIAIYGLIVAVMLMRTI